MMDLSTRVHPELAKAFAGFAAAPLVNLGGVRAVRVLEAADAAALLRHRPRLPGVSMEDRKIDGADGAPPISIRLYRPLDHGPATPALLWLHGGGYLLGNLESDYRLAAWIARTLGCLVIAVDYRLAPEYPYPAALDDCAAVLSWMFKKASTLNIDRQRVAIGGASAGGGLAACLALRHRDLGGAPLKLQLLIYPMLDDREHKYPSRMIGDARVWNYESNRYAWRSYLGPLRGSDVPQYSAAARAKTLAGLPDTYIAVGGLDLFLDENLEYAARLTHASIATELHVYPGAFHSFDGAVPGAAVSRRFRRNYLAALRRAFAQA
jgi:acetyl esterase/lipase